jgi:hypothetical protein
MSQRLTALLLTAAVASTGGLCAHDGQEPLPLPTQEDAGTAMAPLPSTTLRVRGTIDEYDLDTRILSFSTPTGSERFPVATTARIRRGSQRVEASELKGFSGYQAAVRYSDSAGIRTVLSVNVFDKAERIPR